jgi:hypothetical protein
MLIGSSAAMSGCSGCASYRRCSAPPSVQQAQLPPLLSQTGLFVTADVPSPDVHPYAPAFALWSDGATKRRWVELPPGSRIDTTDMDDWSFPVGTKFWKEFSRDGRRIETRLLVRVGPGASDWAGAAYVWDADQHDARLAPEGRRDADAAGYVVPSAAECNGCHGGRRSHVLGFSAQQLAEPGVPLSLDALAQQGWLTRAPERPPRIPGDETERAALGYLHANCGHCHNRERPARGDGPRCYDPERSIDFWLPPYPDGGAADMPAVTSTVPRYVTPGEPEDSRLLSLVSRRGARLHMPPLGSQRVDPDGVARLRAWIEALR